MDVGVFRVFKQFYEKFHQSLDPESLRYVEQQLAELNRSGVHLSEKDRSAVRNISKNAWEFYTQFRDNIANDKTTLEFTSAELGSPIFLLIALN